MWYLKHKHWGALHFTTPVFTSFSSFSICTALWTMGPRTAYSTLFTLGFMFSRVSTLPRGDPPFACWDISVSWSGSEAVAGGWSRNQLRSSVYFPSCSSSALSVDSLCSYSHSTPRHASLAPAPGWLDLLFFLLLNFASGPSSVPRDAFRCCRKTYNFNARSRNRFALELQRQLLGITTVEERDPRTANQENKLICLGQTCSQQQDNVREQSDEGWCFGVLVYYCF